MQQSLYQCGRGAESDQRLQGPEQAAAIKERLDAVAASESHPCDVKSVGSQVFAVLPASGSEGVC